MNPLYAIKNWISWDVCTWRCRSMWKRSRLKWLNWRSLSKVFDSTTPRDDIPQAFGVNLTWPMGPGRRPKPSAQLTCPNVDLFLMFLKSFGKIQVVESCHHWISAYEAATDSGDIQCPANENKKEQRNTARNKQGLSSLRHYKWPVIWPAHTLTIKYCYTGYTCIRPWHHVESKSFHARVLLCSCRKKRLRQLICRSWKHGLQDCLASMPWQVPGIFLSLPFCPRKPCFKSFTIKGWPGWRSKHSCFLLTSELNKHQSLQLCSIDSVEKWIDEYKGHHITNNYQLKHCSIRSKSHKLTIHLPCLILQSDKDLRGIKNLNGLIQLVCFGR